MTSIRLDRRSFFAIPGVVFSMFPTLVCPGCWPAYTGFLSALGLPFIPSGVYLLPTTLAFLIIAIVALSFGARRWHRYGPLVVGVAGSVAVFAGKFVVGVETIAYAGTGLLLLASIWNSIPRRATVSASCASCRMKNEARIGKEM